MRLKDINVGDMFILKKSHSIMHRPIINKIIIVDRITQDNEWYTFDFVQANDIDKTVTAKAKNIEHFLEYLEPIKNETIYANEIFNSLKKKL
jgi:hypothetical protein